MKLIENPQVTQPTFTCSKSTMDTSEQYVKSVQSLEAYVETS